MSRKKLNSPKTAASWFRTTAANWSGPKSRKTVTSWRPVSSTPVRELTICAARGAFAVRTPTIAFFVFSFCGRHRRQLCIIRIALPLLVVNTKCTCNSITYYNAGCPARSNTHCESVETTKYKCEVGTVGIRCPGRLEIDRRI